jgi:hypothetical protein
MAVAVATLTVVGVAAGVVSAALRPNAPASSSRPALGVQFPPGHGPFFEGSKVTLTQAAVEAGYPIWRPDDPLASDPSITAVWTGPRSIDNQTLPPMVALEYSSGIEEELWTALYPDPVSYLQGMAQMMDNATHPGTHPFVMINGNPAVLMPPKTDSVGTNAAAIIMVKGGIQLSFHGPVSLAELERVASTV